MFKVFKNFEGNDIAGSIYGEESNPLVIFLHGGGQTRFAWDNAAENVSKKGFYVITYDLRAMEIVFGQKQEITRFMITKKI
tara:strand:+ start:209 stop:451 length:243 start_codon:yes stop_codon:yes gene_type:complete